MKLRLIVSAVVLCLLIGAGCAEKDKKPPPASTDFSNVGSKLDAPSGAGEKETTKPR